MRLTDSPVARLNRAVAAGGPRAGLAARVRPRRYSECDLTALGQVLIVMSVPACGIIYGTDVFSAIVLRPALALVDDRAPVSTMGRVHDFGDRRLRVPGAAGIGTAIAGTAAIAWAGHLGATIEAFGFT